MIYRSNAITPPVDPESLRPKPTHWQRLKIWFDCFINLSDHRWFRALCGGTWVHTSWYYADAVSHSVAKDLFPFPDQKKITFCNWLPLLQLDSGIEYARYNQHMHSLWIIYDTEAEKKQYIVSPQHGKTHKFGRGAMAPGTFERYDYPLKITAMCQFEPSIGTLLNHWPDYDHLAALGVIK